MWGVDDTSRSEALPDELANHAWKLGVQDCTVPPSPSGCGHGAAGPGTLWLLRADLDHVKGKLDATNQYARNQLDVEMRQLPSKLFTNIEESLNRTQQEGSAEPKANDANKGAA